MSFNFKRCLDPAEYWEIDDMTGSLEGVKISDLIDLTNLSPNDLSAVRRVGDDCVLFLSLTRYCDDHTYISVQVKSNLTVGLYYSFEFEPEVMVPPAMAPDVTDGIFRQNGLQFVEARIDRDGYPDTLDIHAESTSTDLPLARVIEIGSSLASALRWKSRAAPSRPYISHLLRTGHPEGILGMRENLIIDAKRDLYNLNTPAGCFELAKDVGQFANSRDGGVLVIGFSTSSRPGGVDLISKLVGVVATDRDLQSMRGKIDSQLHPTVVGLSIDFVTHPDGGYVVIDVPPQPDARKPYIVAAGIVDGKALEAVFAIPYRVHDRNKPVKVGEIHALLAGRLFPT